jgi:hypothetical protein
LFVSFLAAVPAHPDDYRPTPEVIAAAAKTWPYTPPCRPALPVVKHAAWLRNPIDAFILAKLEAAQLTPGAEADKLTLLRRVTFDLTGMPPTLAQQDAFLADTSSDAYEKVVDRLIGSTRYGEKWAQHWLDLVRYAETDGFKADDHRPNAYKYRDYVIQAFNSDLPYDRFVQEQLAGDEIALASSRLALGGASEVGGGPEELRAKSKEQLVIATGFNRLWPDEYNAANLEQRRQEILDDMTEVTGLVFVGLTIGCARCHDHKFDPITHADHYRLQAFFAPMLPRDDLVLATPEEQRRYTEQMKEWEAATAPLRSEMESLLGDKREAMRKDALQKFRKEIQDAVKTAEVKRTPFDQQIAAMAQKQIDRAEKDAPAKMSAEKKKRYQELEQQMAKAAPKPPALPGVMAVTDVGVTAPPVHRLANGDWRRPKEEVQPGFPRVLDRSHLAPPDGPVSRSETATMATTGRRTALALWLTRPDHPLTARVMVNRLWHHHFGKGIVATPNDFGKQGTPPTHPELLDWLAVEFVEHGWSLKHMHRLMVTSATYRQSSVGQALLPASGRETGVSAPPDNSLWGRMSGRRLDGESLRDAMLAISGELNPRMAGPSAKPKLPDKISSYAWKPDANPADQHRRSIYILAKRNMRYPLFDAFDLPDMHNSCACRPQTITAPQALLMLNSELTLERAAAWAKNLRAEHSEDRPALITAAYRAAFARPPAPEELDLAQRFITKQATLLKSTDAAIADFCHALLNANEFGWVD